ncbi:hypothetical protein J2Z44_003752 [Clostridium punense]|uniref:Protein CR006 P-loop domain-containing protein n=2 Tax=Clostridium punense TaxID=1054297 RepID=A0ABS4K994_9CLOT|nr:hypothetical protein [Clostridium punense]MBP2023910.1 hypothetical protein [Clostridium punense]
MAKSETTKCSAVLEVFKKRFTAPFDIEINNQDDVLLNDTVPSFSFKYIDTTTNENIIIERKNLEKVLSQGERRALYILNIIYDIEALKIERKNVLIVADDVSDSFDYKNKYAIIEYLQEMCRESNFKLIILTHNFDFYRTMVSGLGSSLKPWMTIKNETGIEIKLPKYVYKNPFTEIKKSVISGSEKSLLTAIPFIRNIIEYTDSTTNEDYKKLTSLLHRKDDTESITISELINIYQNNIKTSQQIIIPNIHNRVYEVLYIQANDIINSNIEELDIENKIILSIAIRIMAEDLIIEAVKDKDGSMESINKVRDKNYCQTGKLIELYKQKFPSEYSIIKLLEEVNLMTSENIRINSFMFEPIIDMSINHLVVLYNEFIGLK